MPITLTEAFGCDRCQQIFVVNEGGDSIEQLATTYARKRVWRWTGRQWSVVRSTLVSQDLLPLLLLGLLGIVIVFLIATLNAEVGLRVGIVAVLFAMLACFLWVAYRR